MRTEKPGMCNLERARFGVICQHSVLITHYSVLIAVADLGKSARWTGVDLNIGLIDTADRLGSDDFLGCSRLHKPPFTEKSDGAAKG